MPNHFIGTSATTAQSNFGADHPLYKAISALAMLRRTNAALRQGDQVVRAYARGAAAQSAPGAYRVQVPALDYVIYASAAAP